MSHTAGSTNDITHSNMSDQGFRPLVPESASTGRKSNDDETPSLVVLLIIMDDLPHETIWRIWSEQYDINSNEAECTANSQVPDDGVVNQDQALHGHVSTKSNDTKQDECKSLGLSDGKVEVTAIDVTVDITLDSTDVAVSSDEGLSQPPSLTAPTGRTPQEMTTETITVRSLPVRFLIHAKYPEKVQSPWVRERLVSFQLRPGWGSVELTEVMVRMLSEVICVISRVLFY